MSFQVDLIWSGRPDVFPSKLFSWVSRAAKKKKIKIGRQVDLTVSVLGRPNVLPPNLFPAGPEKKIKIKDVRST